MTKHFEPLLEERQTDILKRITPNISLFFVLGRCLALAGILGAILIFVAYAANIEWFWQPITNGPATSPLTSLLVLLSGCSIVLIRTFRVTRLSIILALLACIIALARLLDIVDNSVLCDGIGLFTEIIAREQDQNTPISTGWNTAIVFVLISFSLLLRCAQRPQLGQIFALLAICFPIIALYGYSYDANQFYGQMSPTTILLAILLCSAILLMSARTGIIRAISSPSAVGHHCRLAAMIILLGTYIGGFVVQDLTPDDTTPGLPAYAVIISLLTIITIGYTAVALEGIDRRRRLAERQCGSQQETNSQDSSTAILSTLIHKPCSPLRAVRITESAF